MSLRFATTITIGRPRSVAQAIFRANTIHDERNLRADVHLVANVPDTSSAIGAKRWQRKKMTRALGVAPTS